MRLYEEGRYAEAITVGKQVLALGERILGPEDPALATSLINLATVYRKLGRYAEAEPLLKPALGIYQKALDPERPC